MQVLRNLFGINKKISWEEIACKNSDGKGITLDEYIDGIVNGAIKSINLIKPTRTGEDVSKLDDDVLILNYSFSAPSNVNIYFNDVILKKNVTYTFRAFCDGTITGGNYKVIYLVYGNNSYVAGYMSNTGKPKYTFTPTEDVTLNRVSLDISTGSTFTDFKMKFMLYEGSDEKEYSIHKF